MLVGSANVAALPVKALRSLRRETVSVRLPAPVRQLPPAPHGGEHLRLVGDGDRDREAEALAALGLTDRRNHRPDELSGGEQQRAAFAQALVAGAQVVLADEPTAELDSSLAAALLGAIGTLAERGVTVIVATHDRTVTAAAHTTLELEHGRVLGLQHVPLRAELAAARLRPGPVVAELRDVRKTFHRGGETVVAVDGVSLAVREGELAALVGSSGSGKTTALNLLAGWEQPDAGSVVDPGHGLGRARRRAAALRPALGAHRARERRVPGAPRPTARRGPARGWTSCWRRSRSPSSAPASRTRRRSASSSARPRALARPPPARAARGRADRPPGRGVGPRRRPGAARRRRDRNGLPRRDARPRARGALRHVVRARGRKAVLLGSYSCRPNVHHLRRSGRLRQDDAGARCSSRRCAPKAVTWSRPGSRAEPSSASGSASCSSTATRSRPGRRRRSSPRRAPSWSPT